jgi:hypothetical protein
MINWLIITGNITCKVLGDLLAGNIRIWRNIFYLELQKKLNTKQVGVLM